MSGSAFISEYARKGLPAWEAAALSLARTGGLTPWPWVDISLADGADTAVVRVMSDVLSVGSVEDFVRLPLTPSTAQGIGNLSGALLTTAWLEYQLWRSAPLKLAPHGMVPNLGANLEQYAAHSMLINDQIRAAGGHVGQLVSGIKKGVIVSNIWKTGKVVIFGWYEPSPPAPVVFDDGKPMSTPGRQPVQPISNFHGDFYVDYSHGIRLVAPTCVVNGQPWETLALYQHPQLSRLVNRRTRDSTPDGPIRVPRYPSNVPVASATPVGVASMDRMGRTSELAPPVGVPDIPSVMEIGLDVMHPRRRGGF